GEQRRLTRDGNALVRVEPKEALDEAHQHHDQSRVQRGFGDERSEIAPLEAPLALKDEDRHEKSDDQTDLKSDVADSPQDVELELGKEIRGGAGATDGGAHHVDEREGEAHEKSGQRTGGVVQVRPPAALY